MKIGVIGCGRISKNHFESIKHCASELELVAVCDKIESRAVEASRKYGGESYTDVATMLSSSECDIVSICTPSGLHPEHGIQAAEAGCHVIVEKPMSIDLEGADNLIKACDRNHVELFVVKQNRLNTTLQLLKKAIDQKRFGQIYMVQSNVFWTRPQDYYDQALWRGTWEFDGGAFMNQASHYVDAVQWLIGNVESVMASTSTMAREIEAEDTGVAIVKFRNGVVGTINVTMLTYPKNFEGSITILGEKGTAKIGGVAVNKVEKWEFEEYDDDDKLLESVNYQPPNVYGYGHIPFYENVVASLENEHIAPFTDGRGGRKSVELILAIYRSAKLGKRISLPLDA